MGLFIQLIISANTNSFFLNDTFSSEPGHIQYLYFSYPDENSQEITLKKIGVYSFEFMGASLGNASSLFSGAYIALVTGPMIEEPNLFAGAISYSVSNFLVTSTFTAGFGKILGEKGNWWHSAIGAGIGALIGSSMFYLVYFGSEQSSPCWEVISAGVLLTAPQLGAVIGFNLK